MSPDFRDEGVGSFAALGHTPEASDVNEERMSSDHIIKAAEKARSLLRNRPDIESVGVSRGKDGDLCVRVDVEPGTDKERIHRLLLQIGAPVVVRTVSGQLSAQ
jgi:hypothetical protein